MIGKTPEDQLTLDSLAALGAATTALNAGDIARQTGAAEHDALDVLDRLDRHGWIRMQTETWTATTPQHEESFWLTDKGRDALIGVDVFQTRALELGTVHAGRVLRTLHEREIATGTDVLRTITGLARPNIQKACQQLVDLHLATKSHRGFELTNRGSSVAEALIRTPDVQVPTREMGSLRSDVLAEVARHEAGTYAAAITRRLNASNSTVKRALTHLLTSGYVEEAPNPTRSTETPGSYQPQTLRVTEAGREALTNGAPDLLTAPTTTRSSTHSL